MTATKLLIVAATVLEVRAFLSARGILDDVEDWDDVGWPIVAVDEDCWLTVSGIGRANASGATAWAIATRGLAGDRVVNVGIAGALPDYKTRNALALLNVVVAKESVFAEEGIFLRDGWRDMEDGLGFALHDAKWCNGNRVQCSETLSAEIALKLGSDVVTRCAIATVASCSGTNEAAEEVSKRTQAVAEGMEGAAVVATANVLGCASAEVRVISNTCGARAAQRWKMKSALVKLHEVLDALVG